MKPPHFMAGGLVFLLMTHHGLAQEVPAKAPAKPKTGASLSSHASLEKKTKPAQPPPEAQSPEETVQLRPFVLTLPREHLFGDWDGLLPALAALGITPTLSYVTDVASNPSGGRNQGSAYSDNIGLDLQFDLNKIVGLEGGTFQVSMSQRDGTSLSQRHVGNVFTIQQDFGGQTFHLIDVAYNQELFDKKVELRLGRVAAGDDFLVSPYDYLFMQNGFDGNPVGIFFNSPGMTAYPNAAWGARVKVTPLNGLYVMAGVYNGDPSIRAIGYNGANLSMDGPAFAIAEIGYRTNGLPGDSQYLGDYKIGAWYDDSDYTNYTTEGSAAPASMRRGNWGAYALFDQVILPFAQPGSNRGMGVFGSFLLSPDQSVSQMPYFFTAGVVCRGIDSSRPRDLLGFGGVFGQFSSDLQGAQEREQLLNPAGGVQSNETALELTYRCSMHGGALFLQPDLQYIIRPGGTGQIQNAFVLGCQIGINF